MSNVDTLRASRIADLKVKLKQREDRPGFQANVPAIKRSIAELADERIYRDIVTGEFVTIAYAIQNPESTEVVEVGDDAA